jgi:hypothetical protein
VTRVQLVDVDVPCTQTLVEPVWDRLPVSQGITLPVETRMVEVTVNSPDSGDASTTAVAFLPMLMDTILGYQKLPDRTVRFLTAHRAPFPIAAIAGVWRQMRHEGMGALRLVGLNTPHGTEVLSPGAVSDDDAFSFRARVSSEVYAALPGEVVSGPGGDVEDPASTGLGLYLYASPIPGPSYLAHTVSRAITAASYGAWTSFECSYNPVTDRFEVCGTVGGGVGPDAQVVLSGALFQALGIGGVMGATRDGGLLPTACGSMPFMTACGQYAFGRVRSGSPGSAAELVETWVSAALNTYSTDGFDGLQCPGAADPPAFQVALPGVPSTAVEVEFPMGRGTLEALVDALNDTLAATPETAAIGLHVALHEEGTVVVFASDPTLNPRPVFGLDMRGLPPGPLARLGMTARAYPFGASQCSDAPVAHVPLAPISCTPPRGRILCEYRPETQGCVLRSEPFPPFSATITAVGGQDQTLTPYIDAEAEVLHGLQCGARVMLVTVAGVQVAYGYVVAVPTAFSVQIACEGTPGAPLDVDATIVVVPQDRPPLCVYFGPPPAPTPGCCGAGPGWAAYAAMTLPPGILGFQARTYEAGDVLCSPGSVSVLQDPYIVVCLGFDGTVAEPLTGDVFYPLGPPIVFAKVGRAASLFKADFYKVYDHTFEGSGRTVSFIRVRILNANGTPYQTHGHTVAITLLFNTRQTVVGFGGGYASVPIRDDGWAGGAGGGGGNGNGSSGSGSRGFPQRQTVPVGGGRAGVSSGVGAGAGGGGPGRR